MSAITWTGTSTNLFNDSLSWDSPPYFDTTETLVVDTAASIVAVGANSEGDEVLIVNNAGARLRLTGAVNPALFLTSATIAAGTLDLAIAGTLDLGLNGAGTLLLGASGHVVVGSGANAMIMSDGAGKSVIDGSGAFDLAGGTLNRLVRRFRRGHRHNAVQYRNERRARIRRRRERRDGRLRR